MSTPVPCLICKESSSFPLLLEEEVIFVLQQVLQVPDSLVSRKRVGEGSLALCGDCHQLVGECREVHEELCSVKRKWNECRARVVRKVKAAAVGVKEEEVAPGGGQDAMQLEIRRFVVNRNASAFSDFAAVVEEQETVPPEEDGAWGMHIDVDKNPVSSAEGYTVVKQEEASESDEDSPVIITLTGTGGEIGTNSSAYAFTTFIGQDEIGATEENAADSTIPEIELAAKRQGFVPGKKSNTPKKARMERAASTPLTTECLFCPRKFRGNSLLIAHMRVHTGERPFWCALCHREFSQKGSLKLHLRIHRSKKPARALSRECLFCRKTFLRSAHLVNHLRVHTRERPFWCALCDREFTHKGNLKSHQRIHSGENRALPLSLECLFCRKKLRKNSHLEEHMRVHTRERPFWCGVCDKEFAQQAALNIHQQTHTGEKPFQCELCKKRFLDSSHLTEHVRAHLGEKPWKCPDCGKGFGEKSQVTKHRRVHTGERPYKCGLCPMTFSHSNHLLRHRKKLH